MGRCVVRIRAPLRDPQVSVYLHSEIEKEKLEIIIQHELYYGVNPVR